MSSTQQKTTGANNAGVYSHRVILALSIFLFAAASGGCAGMVTSYIESRATTTKVASDSTRAVLREIAKSGITGFSTESYCSTENDPCVRYLKASATTEIEKLDFSIGIHESNDRASLDLARNEITTFSGQVVLLHGYGTSKLSMLAAAVYFRFLGFDVLIPDLLGHGESDGRLGFGINDVEFLNGLLDTQADSSRPIYLVGNSMGALAALELAKRRTDITGVILQAPMLPFDEAAVLAAHHFSSQRLTFISDDNIRQGAIAALTRSGLTPADTDIRPILKDSMVPILLLASESDSVAPLSYFSDIRGPLLSIANVAERSHLGMALIGQQEHTTIQAWLQATQGQQAQ